MNSLTKLGQKLVNLGENCEKMKKQKQPSLPQLKESEKRENQVNYEVNFHYNFMNSFSKIFKLDISRKRVQKPLNPNKIITNFSADLALSGSKI